MAKAIPTGEKGATLVIHAPDYRVKGGAKRFEAVLKDGIGQSYAIPKSWLSKLHRGSKVVVLRKDKNKGRAEGRLVQLVPTGRTSPQGIKAYDVHIQGLKKVGYRPERLNRFGVALIDC